MTSIELSNVKVQGVVQRSLKYFVEGLVVAVTAFYIPRSKMSLEELFMIALTAAATFAILDMFAPAIAGSARQGAGFGIGATMVGFNPLK